MPKLTLISSKDLTFSKPKCGCGIVSISNKQRKLFKYKNQSRRHKKNQSKKLKN